ncbi:Uncharacterized protein TCM_005594 [Theobroma cacao]|uniref:Uncharacterized protein n=1 Tax=Theobroma cacao TaxID=3641 RepID=A0A061E222_THECC|nr:Uncharacterized protein TCM_005594 [Theobroma cacao]
MSRIKPTLFSLSFSFLRLPQHFQPPFSRKASPLSADLPLSSSTLSTDLPLSFVLSQSIFFLSLSHYLNCGSSPFSYPSSPLSQQVCNRPPPQPLSSFAVVAPLARSMLQRLDIARANAKLALQRLKRKRKDEKKNKK